MMNMAILALDVQNGFITPQNHDIVFRSIDVISRAIDAQRPLLAATSELTSDGDESIDAFLWHLHQSEEASEPFEMLASLVEEASASLYLQRLMPSAWTHTAALFAKKHDISDIAIVGINHAESLLSTILDIRDHGLQVTLVADALAADLNDLPLPIRHDVRIVDAASLFE